MNTSNFHIVLLLRYQLISLANGTLILLWKI